MDSTYHCKSQQNATLTGQEKETFSQRYLSFVLLYFDFWTILVQLELELELYFYLNTVNLSDKIIVHESFNDSSHFVHVNINLLTHTTSGQPVIL